MKERPDFLVPAVALFHRFVTHLDSYGVRAKRATGRILTSWRLPRNVKARRNLPTPLTHARTPALQLKRINSDRYRLFRERRRLSPRVRESHDAPHLFAAQL